MKRTSNMAMLASIVLLLMVSGCASNSRWSNTIKFEFTYDKNDKNKLDTVKGISSVATLSSGESREGLAMARPNKEMHDKGLGGGIASYKGWIHYEFTEKKNEGALFLNTSTETYALAFTPETSYQIPEEDLPDAETILWKLGKKYMYSVGIYRINEEFRPPFNLKKWKVLYVSWIKREINVANSD